MLLGNCCHSDQKYIHTLLKVIWELCYFSIHKVMGNLSNLRVHLQWQRDRYFVPLFVMFKWDTLPRTTMHSAGVCSSCDAFSYHNREEKDRLFVLSSFTLVTLPPKAKYRLRTLIFCGVYTTKYFLFQFLQVFFPRHSEQYSISTCFITL